MKPADRVKGWKTKAAAGWQKLRRQRGLMVGVGAAVTLGVAAVFLVLTDTGTDLVDSVREEVGAAPTLTELKSRVKAAPEDAAAHVRLGRGLFAENLRAAGLKAYDRALTLDPELADEAVLQDLVSCYGRKEQSRAHAILVKHKLVRAERYLDDLAKNSRWLVRTGAVQTLEKLGKATRDDYLNLWLTDLRTVKECKVRQYAVEKLGELGDKRALDAIREARKVEDETTPWFTAKCLGDRAGNAEKKILAAR